MKIIIPLLFCSFLYCCSGSYPEKDKSQKKDLDHFIELIRNSELENVYETYFNYKDQNVKDLLMSDLENWHELIVNSSSIEICRYNEFESEKKFELSSNSQNDSTITCVIFYKEGISDIKYCNVQDDYISIAPFLKGSTICGWWESIIGFGERN